jgi:hypothetical protein
LLDPLEDPFEELLEEEPLDELLELPPLFDAPLEELPFEEAPFELPPFEAPLDDELLLAAFFAVAMIFEI